MSLRHRFSVIVIVGLVLGLALLGRELFGPSDVEPAPASVAKIAAVAEPPAPAAPSAAAQSAPPAEVATPAPNVSSSGATLKGLVIDAATRQPVREFNMEFHALHQPQPGDVAPGARTFRTKDGRFEWSDIPPRRWIVTTSARGYQRLDLDGLQLSTDDPTEVVMPLQRGHALRGRVYDETSGAGIASATISFREAHIGRFEGNFRMRVSTTSGKDGSFVLDGVPAGSIIVSVHALPKYGSREIDVAIGERTAPLQVALSTGGSLKGYLAAADGTPVAGWISLNNPDEGVGSSRRTNDAGEFSFERLRPGRYRMTGRAGDRTVTREFVLAKDERREGLVLALNEAARSIRGVVTGLRAGELERLEVLSFAEATFEDIGRTRVDARGAYEIKGVQPGSVVVKASINRGRHLTKKVQMPADSDLVVNLEFPRGSRLSGNVTRGGKPVAGFWLEPRAVNEQPLYFDGVGTSERGEYAIEDVPNGEYYILLGSYRSRNFEVNGDTVFDIDVPGTRLSGRTVEEGGKVPVVGADVFVWSTQAQSTRVHWQNRSNHLGEFEIVGLEPGDYMVSAYKPGYEMHRERFSYNAGSEPMTLRLRQGQGVAIRLLDASNGQPLRNAQLGETIDGRYGSGIRLRLDENGVAYIPRALTGSTLRFHSQSYITAEIAEWDGQEMDVRLQRAP